MGTLAALELLKGTPAPGGKAIAAAGSRPDCLADTRSGRDADKACGLREDAAGLAVAAGVGNLVDGNTATHCMAR